jgi:phycoerythrin-associated linker protein
MDIHQFLELFVGRWRSQRSDHQFSKGNGSGDTRAVIEVTALNLDDPALVAICQKHDIDHGTAIHPMKMSWEEESLSSNKPKGQALIVPVPHDLTSPQKGLILTSQGKGVYELGTDEALTIKTVTAQNVIEERIWYGNPNLRFRVATLLQGDLVNDRHVRSSKFYSEIRGTIPKS